MFTAIADPVRRRILLLLRVAPMTAGQIAAEFEVSRPAISRHLKVLREAGVVEADRGPQDGRERSYALRAEAFAEVDQWLAQVRGPARFAHLLASPALDTEVRRARRASAATEQQCSIEKGTA